MSKYESGLADQHTNDSFEDLRYNVRVSDKIYTFYEDGFMTDFTLISMEDLEVECRKCVLSAVSDDFEPVESLMDAGLPKDIMKVILQLFTHQNVM